MLTALPGLMRLFVVKQTPRRLTFRLFVSSLKTVFLSSTPSTRNGTSTMKRDSDLVSRNLFRSDKGSLPGWRIDIAFCAGEWRRVVTKEMLTRAAPSFKKGH